jgi:hypothetical protein
MRYVSETNTNPANRKTNEAVLIDRMLKKLNAVNYPSKMGRIWGSEDPETKRYHPVIEVILSHISN